MRVNKSRKTKRLHSPQKTKVIIIIISINNNYRIRILDQHVNEIILSQYNYLTLEKDSYKISVIKDLKN